MMKKNEITDFDTVYEITQNEFLTLIGRMGLTQTAASKIIGKSKSYVCACVYGAGRVKPIFIKKIIDEVGEAMMRIGFKEVLDQREIRAKTIEARANE